MKAIRERMKKINLSIATKTEDVVGAGPEEIDSPTKSGNVKAAGREARNKRKKIERVSDAELATLYEIGGTVMESTHSGMDVLFGTRLLDGLEVVVKTRDKSTSFKGNWEEREWRDTTVVQLNMPQIDSMCAYLAVYETWEKYYVIMEKALGMDLFEHLQQEHLKQEDSRQILHQMLHALDAMHSVGRIHKDLKLENLVVDLHSPKMRRCSSNGSTTSIDAKLIDFDTVQDWEPMSPKAKDVLGTDGYIAPEAYSGEYSPASDIYCVGVMMYKLLTGRFPSRADLFDDLPGENWVGSPAMKRIQDRLKKEKIDFKRAPLDRCPEAQDLVRKMLAFDPNDRPSAAEALEHKWFTFQGDELRAGAPSPTSVKSREKSTSVSTTSAGSSQNMSPSSSSSQNSADGEKAKPNADKAETSPTANKPDKEEATNDDRVDKQMSLPGENPESPE